MEEFYTQKSKKAELPQEKAKMKNIPKLASAQERVVSEAMPRLFDSFRSGLMGGKYGKLGGTEDHRALRVNFEFALNGIIEKKKQTQA